MKLIDVVTLGPSRHEQVRLVFAVVTSVATLIKWEKIMAPKFRSGQTVLLNRNVSSKWAAGGEYKVIRLLPEIDGELRYRIKSVREPHERVVREDDLQKG
jgi:hypothetical protein